MKTRIISLLLLFFSMHAHAHRAAGDTRIITDAIAVNGLQVGEKYTLDEILDALGTDPTELRTPTPYDEYNDAYEIRYGKDRFSYIDGEFYGFTIWTKKYAVNNYIRIGDPISKIKDMGGITALNDDENWIEWRPSEDGLYSVTSIVFYYGADGKINCIIAFIMSL